MSEQPGSAYIEDDRINGATEFASGDEIYPHMAGDNVTPYAEFKARQQAKEQARQAIAELESTDSNRELTVPGIMIRLSNLTLARGAELEEDVA